MKHIFRSTNQIEVGQELVKLESVTKSFADQEIIKNIGFTVAKGEFVVLTGAAGSGKSTILRTIEGLERPDSGTVTRFGNDLFKMSDKDRSRETSGRVGVGFQLPNLDTGQSLYNNIISLAETKGKVDRDRAVQLAVALGLADKLNRRENVAHLSGGEKQKASLARLLLPKPELVLLDEPTASIDPSGKSVLYDLLRDLNQTEDTTFIVVSHDTVALDYADRAIVVDSGHILSDGPVAPNPIFPAA